MPQVQNPIQRSLFCWQNWLMLTCCCMSLSIATAHADDWPQWGGPNRDCIWRETGIVRTLPAGELPRVWSVALGEGYSGPAVADGKVFVTDFFDRDAARGNERVHCINAETGANLWTHAYPVRYDISYPAGPRATPVVDGDRVYTVGATGMMFCFKISDGAILWQKDFKKDYETTLPTWGMAASPLILDDQVITLVGGANGATVVSFQKDSGKELWRAIDDHQVGYCPPMLAEVNGMPQVVVWHPNSVTGLDPMNGDQIWDVPFSVNAGLCISTPRQVGNRLFLTSFYNGSLMLEFNGDKTPKTVWKGSSNNEIKTDGLHSIMSTPLVNNTHIYGVCSYGQLRCLDAKTGKRVWESFEATGHGRWWNAFLIPNGDKVFIHNEQGDLIIAELSPTGYKEISRSKLIEPTRPVQRRMTIWSHPAFAMKSVFARNDKELIRVSLDERKTSLAAPVSRTRGGM
jgi:outer membrane protein assembly factor BamB